GLADYVLPVEQLPEALVKYVQHFYVNGTQPADGAVEATDEVTQVLALLRARSKFDFRCYRKKMLTRRIQRRMGLNRIGQIQASSTLLRNNPEEVKLLARDLLISVTSFFREPEAMELLRTQVIGPLVESKETDAPLRIWVPGCATGEEAYTIAMLVLEALAT